MKLFVAANIIVLFSFYCATAKSTSAKSTSAKSTSAKSTSADVRLTWSYQDFPLKMRVFLPKDDLIGKQISETHVVKTKDQMPVGKEVLASVPVPYSSSKSLVLVLENTTAQDVYFFAVPHELNPHHASAGHYFECLCTNRVYKIPPGKWWYRIVRVNLNDSFQKIPSFTINHQVIGLSQKTALTDYKDQLYEKE